MKNDGISCRACRLEGGREESAAKLAPSSQPHFSFVTPSSACFSELQVLGEKSLIFIFLILLPYGVLTEECTFQ